MMPALPLTVLRHSTSVNVGTFHAFRNTPLTYFYGKPIVQPFFRKREGQVYLQTWLAELEEQSYRWRAGRLADLGYVDFYDALDLFRPLEPAQGRIQGAGY